MARKMTIDDFVSKAKAVHGDKYDYSKVELVNAQTKVCIICPEHGEFWQAPTVHVKGHGCKECGTVTAIGKADYAARAKTRERTMLEKHGVKNVMQLESSKKALENTMLEKYGVRNARQLDSVVDKARQTNLQKYGVKSYIQSDEGKRRIAMTNKQKYGAENFMQSDAHFVIVEKAREKAKMTCQQKYGADCYVHSQEYQHKKAVLKEKEIITKLKNGTCNTSSCDVSFSL